MQEMHRVFDRSVTESGDSVTSTGNKLSVGLLHQVPDLGYGQRLGGACPGQLVPPWSVRGSKR